MSFRKKSIELQTIEVSVPGANASNNNNNNNDNNNDDRDRHLENEDFPDLSRKSSQEIVRAVAIEAAAGQQRGLLGTANTTADEEGDDHGFLHRKAKALGAKIKTDAKAFRQFIIHKNPRDKRIYMCNARPWYLVVLLIAFVVLYAFVFGFGYAMIISTIKIEQAMNKQ